jgi:hypothetical protein
VKKQSQYSPEVVESMKPYLNSLATDAQVQIRLLNEMSNLACVSTEGTKVSRWDESTRDSRAYDILIKREQATTLKIKAIVDVEP